MTLDFKLQISRQVALLVLVPLVIELIFLIVMAGMLKETENRLLNEERSKAIVAQSKALSKAFYDAGVAHGKYSVTRSPLYSKRIDENERLISEDLDKLTKLVGDDKTKQETLARIRTITSTGIENLKKSLSEIDRGVSYGCEFRARPIYKKTRQLADQLQDELLGLDEQHRRIENSPSFGSGIVLPIMLSVSVLLNLAVACLLFGSMKSPADN